MNKFMNWPEVLELNNIIISSVLGNSSKGSLTIAADPPSSALRHFRYGTRKSPLKIVQLPQETRAANVIEEPVIYGGLLFRHFGHLLTESIHRLWPRYALKELHTARVAFNLVNHAKIVPYITEALNFHGFSKSQIISITEPTLFRRLFVGQQARTLAGPTTIPNYQSMLDRDLARRLPPSERNRKLYLSRLRHQHTGSYYGESFVQQKLQELEFEIIYPEQHSLTDLVRLLRSAEIAIFAEGSAVHALELCGSCVPATAVISRRPESEWRFKPLLSEICDKWLIADHLLMTAGLAADAKKHSGVVDLGALVRDLSAFADLPAPLIRSEDMLAAIDNDLEAHIQHQSNERTGDYEVRAERLRELVRGVWRRNLEIGPCSRPTSAVRCAA